jgi:transposase
VVEGTTRPATAGLYGLGGLVISGDFTPSVQEGEIAEAITLTQDFAALVRQRQPDHLERWLERATASGLQAFQSFANGLRADYAAVKAGVTLSWSTGPVEGQINRLKMLKRQMYGRAGIGLLRQRVLHPT